ncbi:hypothetical protein AVEN_191972-1 [Araneus ventricosus]|uniref:Uncharacterized protein n=1 Tax=Araneus ventricosus TaxID=182803 RepID=A0A4Y2QT50_ARAVE|nr:hypothetical protein AVEN_191972-1 [Araneus ventricosus]
MGALVQRRVGFPLHAQIAPEAIGIRGMEMQESSREESSRWSISSFGSSSSAETCTTARLGQTHDSFSQQTGILPGTREMKSKLAPLISKKDRGSPSVKLIAGVCSAEMRNPR